MADTVGSLIDKLMTVELKMWNNQEALYPVRKMTFEEFKQEYFSSEEGARKMFDMLKKGCDLNVQRNTLMDEIDTLVVTIAEVAKCGGDLSQFIQRKHKTY